MLLNLWMTVQFIVVLLIADVDSVIPQSPTHLVVLVLLGAALLSPIAPWAAAALVRMLSLAPDMPRTPSAQSSSADKSAEGPDLSGVTRAWTLAERLVLNRILKVSEKGEAVQPDGLASRA